MPKTGEPAAALVEHVLVDAGHRLLVGAVIVQRHLREAHLELLNLVLDLGDLAARRVNGAYRHGNLVSVVVCARKLAAQHDKRMKPGSRHGRGETEPGAPRGTVAAAAGAPP